MNIPISTVGSQVYATKSVSNLSVDNISIQHANRVQFPSAASSQFQSILSTNQEDVHICGGCKQNFSDINFFVEHKHSGCIQNTQKSPSAASTLVGQSTIDYLSTTSSRSGEDSTSPSLGAPIFRVIVDGSNLSLQPGAGNSRHTSSCRGNGDSQILRSRLLGIQNDQQIAVQEQNITTNAGGMQAIVMQQQSRREFQIDEEAVATILANQLASEDGTSAHANMPYSRTAPILVLGNMDSEMIIPQSRESSDLRSMGLPGEAAVVLGLGPEQKQCCSNKPNVDLEGSQPAVNTARKVVSGELKDKLWSQVNVHSIVKHVKGRLPVVTNCKCIYAYTQV
ncbi:hypothetical protein B7P43_G15363 [Cryptotermes secundus]|uniref:Uncharacterized protein n=1 Tax=Cryptotermes secundus TaxID=105785 RepID=A0A2J7R9F9_9NEOP|nr:hypothetical protein B7P43_G15363 [Cryptotermes secundus]